MPSFQDFTYLSSNGKTRIHARKCIPDGAPRAVIQIVHGIAEHINRYDDFARFLAEHGFVAVGEDHLGHGQTAETKEDLGFFAEEDGWNCVVNDLNLLRDQMHGEYPDLPYLFFGHNMGSFLVRTYLNRFTVRVGDDADLDYKFGMLQSAVEQLAEHDSGTLDLSIDQQVHFSPG